MNSIGSEIPSQKNRKGRAWTKQQVPSPLVLFIFSHGKAENSPSSELLSQLSSLFKNLRNKVQKRCNRRAEKNPKHASKPRFSLQSIPFSSAFVRWVRAFTSKTQILNQCTSVSVVQKQPLCPAWGINRRVWAPRLRGGTRAAARGTHEHTQTKPGQDENCGAAAPGIWGAMTLTLS